MRASSARPLPLPRNAGASLPARFHRTLEAVVAAVHVGVLNTEGLLSRWRPVGASCLVHRSRTPADLYERSTRPYPAKLTELVYPGGVLRRPILQQGSLKWKCERTFISEVLAREQVGLLEVDDACFEVCYRPLPIGWFDGRRQHLERAEEVTQPAAEAGEHFVAAACTTP